MAEVKEDLLSILNQALKLEHTARTQYFTRAEMIAATLAKIEETHKVKVTKENLEINLRDEKDAIAFYKQIRNKVGEYRKKLQDEFGRLEEQIRNVINDEQEHLERLSLFVEQLEERVENKRRYEYTDEGRKRLCSKERGLC